MSDYEDDDEDELDEMESHSFIIKVKYSINVTRIIGNTVHPSKLELRCDMEILPDYFYDDEKDEESDDSEVVEPATEPTTEEPEINDFSEDDYLAIIPNIDPESGWQEIIEYVNKPEELKAIIDEIRKAKPEFTDNECISYLLENLEDFFDTDSDIGDKEYEDQNDEFSKARLGLTKIKFWLENLVSGSVIFCRNNKWARRSFLTKSGHLAVNNHIMILPNDPTDSLMAQILHSKFNALADGFIIFETVHIESNNDPNDVSYFFYGNGRKSLPQMKDWMGEPHWFTNPWWARNDASTIDVICPEDADMNEPPKFAYSLDFLEDVINPPVYEENKIVRAEFRPKIVGSDDVEEE